MVSRIPCLEYCQGQKRKIEEVHSSNKCDDSFFFLFFTIFSLFFFLTDRHNKSRARNLKRRDGGGGSGSLGVTAFDPFH